MTEQEFNNAIEIYKPTGGHRTGKIYGLKGNDLTVTGGGGTRINKNGLVENLLWNIVNASHNIPEFFNLINNGTLVDEGETFRGFNYYRFTENTATGLHTVYMASSILRQYVERTIHVKKGNRSEILVGERDHLDGIRLLYNFDTKVAVFQGVSGNPDWTYSVTELEDGWVKLSFTTNTASGLSDSFHVGLTDDSGNQNYTGTDGYFFISHVQVVLQPIGGIKPYQLTTGSAAFPKIDYSTGKAAFLIEPARTNMDPFSFNLTTANWTQQNGITVSLNQVGIMGEPNTAVLLTDSITTNFSQLSRAVVTLNARTKISVWIKKDNNQTRFPEIYIGYRRASDAVNRETVLQLNTATGEFDYRLGLNTNITAVLDRGEWWECVIISADIPDRTQGFAIRPAMSTTLGGAFSGTVTGSIIVGYIGISYSTIIDETPIITNGAAVTRTGNVLSYDHGSNIRYFENDKTVYVEFEPLEDTNNNLIHIFNLLAAVPRTNIAIRYNGEVMVWKRPRNVSDVVINTGIVSNNVKVLFKLESRNIKIFINGISFNWTHSYDDTLENPLHRISIGSIRIFDFKFLPWISDAEAINLTTL